MMREIQRHIKEATMELETDDFIWFLRELAEWCNSEADMQEYKFELTEDEQQ